jgi:hypothetical protein
MPDYHLYDEWVHQQIQKGIKGADLRYYTDYSIGFTTRGCFRKCSYCVNRNKEKVELASPITEFFDPSRKAICLLDDQFFGYPKYEEILDELQSIGKPFQYKQGLDIRLMTSKLAKKLSGCKYDGDYIFAFDDIIDSPLIEEKLSLWREHTSKKTKLYVLVGYNEVGVSSRSFWVTDLAHAFKRIFTLAEYDCNAYVMRHEDYLKSPFIQIYNLLASWTNQPWALHTMSFRQFCIGKGMANLYTRYKHDPDRYLKDGHSKKSPWLTMELFLEQYPKMSKWFDMKFGEKVID